ncbi:MAG: hypothetical protein Kow0075_00710 [Salibacteraceae bacterium]
MKQTISTLAFILLTVIAFAQYPVVSIYDIQYVTSSALGNCDDQTFYLGDTVIIRAKVVMDGDLAVPSGVGATNGHKNLWLQQGNGGPFSGIDLFNLSSVSVSEDPHNLLAGDSVEVIGVIEDYNGETEIMPLAGNSITILGQNQPIYATAIDLADLNDSDRNNKLETGEKWEGVYVEVRGVTVASVDYFSGGSRVSFNVEDQFGNLMNVSDRFIVQKLPGEGGNFVPPNVGDQLDTLRGIIAHSKNNCAGFNGRGYEMYPFQESDYVYGAAAPRIFNISRTPVVPNSSQSVAVSCEVTDNDGNVAGVSLHYATGTSGSFSTLTMSNAGGSSYQANIPAQTDGTLVRWYITAVDDSGLVTSIPNSDPNISTFLYRVRNNGLSIFDIQYTPYSNGNSPYVGETVTVEGVVTSTINTSDTGDLGFVYIQQENQLTYAGIWLEQGSTLGALKRGDKVSVEGVVTENFGMTALTDITSVNVVGTGHISPLVLNPDSFTIYSASQEQFEGMLVKFQHPMNGPVYIVEKNADAITGNNYGEYRIGTDQFNLAGVRVLAGRQSGNSSLYCSYVNDSLWATTNGTMGVRPYVVNYGDYMKSMSGILYYSFGNMKLLPRNNNDVLDYAGNIYAQFSVSNDTVCINKPAGFFNESSVIADEFNWDFGDGQSSTEENPNHAYNTAGWMNVSLTVKNDVDGAEAVFSKNNAVYVDTSTNCALGIENHTAKTELMPYPNPASEWIYIQSPSPAGKTFSVELYDVNGRQLLRRVSMRSTEQINVGHLSSGPYIMVVKDHGDVIRQSSTIVVK